METPQEIASQWEELQREKQNIADKIKELNFKIQNPGEAPETKELLAAKNDLKGKEKETRRKIDLLKNVIDFRLGIGDYICGLRSRLQKEELNKGLEGLAINLEKFAKKRKIAPDIVNCLKSQILLMIEVDSAELLKRLMKWNNEDELQRNLLKQDLPAMENIIAKSSELYCENRRLLKQELDKTEEQLEMHNGGIMQWATQNRVYLKWILENQHLPASAVISVYKERFPNDDISGLLPILLKPKQTSPLRPPEKPVAPKETYDASKTKEESFPQDYQIFWYQTGEELPSLQKRSRFLKKLKTIFNSKFQNLNPELVYKKLLDLLQTPPNQRTANYKKATLGKFKRWFKVKAAKFRFLFNVNEIKKRVMMHIQLRKDVYGHHHRS